MVVLDYKEHYQSARLENPSPDGSYIAMVHVIKKLKYSASKGASIFLIIYFSSHLFLLICSETIILHRLILYWVLMGRATEYWLLDRRTHQSMHSKLHRSWEERGNREDKVNPVGNVGLEPKSLSLVLRQASPNAGPELTMRPLNSWLSFFQNLPSSVMAGMWPWMSPKSPSFPSDASEAQIGKQPK